MSRHKNYNKWGKKGICAVLCASLLVTSGFVSGCTRGEKGTDSDGTAAQAGNGGAGQAGASGAGQAGASDAVAQNDGTKIVFHPPVDTPAVIPEEKEETVYVKADAYGRPDSTTVEVTLGKIAGTDPVEDRSNLRDIKNTEGDEEYSEAGEGRYLWENHGADIHYKGISDEALPVDVKVTYYLEGEEVTAERIAGKTGAVRIRFDYDNHTEVPFMVLSSVLLPGDVFSDIEVENGRLMDFGDQKAVLGLAFPGLMDSLKLADYEVTEEVDLPEYVEISARAEKFELDFTATVISTGLFEEVKDKDLGDLEDMADDMKELTDASGELVDAAGELADGGSEFGAYLRQYFDGIGALSEGTDALDKGLSELSSNISVITEGSSALEKGLSQVEKSLSQIDLSSLTSEESEQASQAAAAALQSLGQNTAALSEKLAGVQTAATALETYREYLEKYAAQVEALKAAVDENPAPVLTELASDLADGLNAEASAQANEAVKEAAEIAAAAVVDTAMENAAQATAESARNAARETIDESGALDDLGLTEEQIRGVKEQLAGEIADRIEAAQGEAPEIEADPEAVEISLDELLAQTMEQMQAAIDDGYGEITAAKDAVEELVLPDMSALSGEQTGEISQILEQMGQSLTVVSAYAEGMSSAAESLQDLSAGLGELQAGVHKLSEGSTKLNSGLGLFQEALDKASEGSSKLNSALGQVASAGGELGSAFSKLVEGMDAFADGVLEFDKEGIQSLAELTGPEYMAVIRGLRAARDAEHSYTSFSGLCDGQKGSVRFIIETEEVKE